MQADEIHQTTSIPVWTSQYSLEIFRDELKVSHGLDRRKNVIRGKVPDYEKLAERFRSTRFSLTYKRHRNENPDPISLRVPQRCSTVTSSLPMNQWSCNTDNLIFLESTLSFEAYTHCKQMRLTDGIHMHVCMLIYAWNTNSKDCNMCISTSPERQNSKTLG